jgi:predicted nucleotidyltransferase component of viral defense system
VDRPEDLDLPVEEAQPVREEDAREVDHDARSLISPVAVSSRRSSRKTYPIKSLSKNPPASKTSRWR